VRKRRPTLRRRLKTYAAILTVLLLAALVFDLRGIIESRVFYFPMREQFQTPRGVEDVTFTTPDGLTLHAWYLPPRNHQPTDSPAPPAPPAPVILHVHGNAGHIGWHADFSRFLTGHGFGILIFDYRGFGRSDMPRRHLRRDDLLTDTLAAFDYLKTRPDVDPDRIALYGVSLGGVLALAAAAERPDARAVVSIAAFASWRGIARTHGSPLGFAAIKSGLDAADSITKLGSRPVLLVHGAADTIVPPINMTLLETAARAAGVPVQTLTTPAGHNDIVVEELDAQRQIAEFLQEALEPGSP
jgi:uncharacterized protein